MAYSDRLEKPEIMAVIYRGESEFKWELKMGGPVNAQTLSAFVDASESLATVLAKMVRESEGSVTTESQH